MVKIVLRQKAIDDLNDIWNYTFENWSEKQANKYYTTIKNACKEIGDNPVIGKEYFGVIGKLLGLKSEKHIIFYNIISEDRIEILRILHERMDLKNRLKE
ncbi:plasmid stabilization protein [Polaribacter reichenbachii]|uniref:Toxin n=1 Tax=Polaribacter reichenbachii TaxID=996801 RepID=A0A1B8U1J4_9FLAO|nr:type II toxin-antitoxin system RelE/ParE family toxin [Polaribacter reichenbachii]APZ47291.1 plasmid stabilization protein [Polaribacter reichenbachii]AUC17932.1 plasmid stabilization protein [Polaribacter reichenbachii]OBY65743.1 plasmid stabilization protein [Polaribacter reichenbachii]